MAKKIVGADGQIYKVKQRGGFLKWVGLIILAIFIMNYVQELNSDSDNAQVEESEPKVTLASNETVEAKVKASDEKTIELNKPMEIGDCEITITNYKISKDVSDNLALIIDYHFVNKSDEPVSPFMHFHEKAFQNGVETNDIFMVDGVDLEPSQKEIKPGGEIDAQTAVGIDDINLPLDLEIDLSFSFSDKNLHKTTIDLKTLK